MKAMTRELVKCDAELRKLTEQLHDHTWDPDELANVREDIDALLDKRNALTYGTARGIGKAL
jgi:hypothetical protein